MLARSTLSFALVTVLLAPRLSAQQPAADPWAGTYVSPQLTLVLQGQNGRYTGTATLNGQSFPVTLQSSAEGLTGSYRANGMDFPMSLTRNGDGVILGADGESVALSRGTGAGGSAPQRAEAASPLAEQWHNHLAGNMAARYSRYSSGLEGGYSSKTEYHLCRNGEFLFQSSSSVSVDVGGAYGHSGGDRGQRGTWRIITQGDLAGIELRYQSGEVVQARLDYQNGQTLVDGERWLIGRSEICP